jgi:ferredoxin/flavodoxin
MDSVIYYFTGTGNSLKVAKDIASRLGNTSLIKVCKDTMMLSEGTKFKKVGIVFPVYYYGLPVMVKEFVENLILNSNSYVYTIATCGGSVGASVKQLQKILDNKGILLSSAFTIVMPDNYQVMYSPPSDEKQQKLFKLEGEKAQHIADVINKLEKTSFEEINSFPAKLLGGILSKNFNPKDKDRNFWSDEKCNGCGICAKVCPANNIKIEENRPQWLHECEHCLACLHWCPKHSLQYKKGTIKRKRYHHPEISVGELFQSSSK